MVMNADDHAHGTRAIHNHAKTWFAELEIITIVVVVAAAAVFTA